MEVGRGLHEGERAFFRLDVVEIGQAPEVLA